MILVKKLKFLHVLCLSKIDREKVFADVLDKKEASKDQGSQIRQICRILGQNCSDDSTEVTEGVTSTPEIFGNKQ